MKTAFILKQHISVGQKTKGGASAFGDGFNYVVEAGFACAGLDRAKAEAALKRALDKVDHRALGVDLDIGLDPTSENLTRYLACEIGSHHALEWLSLHRGDGAIFSFGNSPTK